MQQAGGGCIRPNAGACTDQGGTLACQPEDGGGNDGPETRQAIYNIPF